MKTTLWYYTKSSKRSLCVIKDKKSYGSIGLTQKGFKRCGVNKRNETRVMGN